MTEKREARSTETREVEQRQSKWRRPELLPEPVREDGFEYRWIRVSMLGQVDPSNISSKLREGWEPVKTTEQPHMERLMMVVENEKFKDNVVIGGLMLCKAPTEMVEERKKFYEEQTRSQMESVDNNFMRENDPRAPLFNKRRTKVTFGSGN